VLVVWLQIVGDWAETVVENLTVSSKAFFEVIEENIKEVINVQRAMWAITQQ